MALPDDTLLVCFVGAQESDQPRVLAWRVGRPVEEVHLSTGPQRMLAELATAPIELPGHLSAAATDLRLAATLAASLPQRSTHELREALSYSRSQEWRVRRQLAAELAGQGLADRLACETRGRIGLRGAVTDVATLYGAWRDGRSEDAVQLLRGIARDRPDRLVLRAPRGWPDPARTRVDAALEWAIAHWRIAADRHRDRNPVDIAPRSTRASALVPTWQPLPAVRRRTVRAPAVVRGLRRLPGLLPIVIAGAAVVVTLSADETPPRPIPSSVAGRWPDGESGAIANLTRAIPFDSLETSASTGDVLLMRLRFRVGTSRRATSKPIGVSFDSRRESVNRVRISASAIGAMPHSGLTAVIAGMAPGEQLRLMRGTTRLLDVAGAQIRQLPDMRDTRRTALRDLHPGRVYFISTRLRVESLPDGARGELGESFLHCGPDRGRRPPPELAHGATVTCRAYLQNWGPRSLRDAHVRFPPHRDGGGRYVSFGGLLSSLEGEPRRVPIWGGAFDFEHRSKRWSAVYVPGSAETRGAAGTRPVPGDPLTWGVVVDVPVTDDPTSRTPQLVFDVRLVDRAQSSRRVTRTRTDGTAVSARSGGR